MARYTGAACRLCRREGTKLFLKGDRCFTEKCGVERRAYPPGQHGQGRTRTSDYGLQLREKQKVKRMYGLAEKQFRGTMDAATRMRGRAGENLLMLLEQRLDNVVFRLGFATSRSEARQLVRHGHFEVNGRKVDVPSFRVKTGMRVTLRRFVARDRAHHRGARGPGTPQRAGLARAREGSVHGRDEGGADARRHHDADSRTAHRRTLLALSRARRPSASRSAAKPREVHQVGLRRPESRGISHAARAHRPELAPADPPATPRDRGRLGDAALRPLLVRTARARLRRDARQRAAARAAVVAQRRGDHVAAHQRRAPRVLDDSRASWKTSRTSS